MRNILFGLVALAGAAAVPAAAHERAFGVFDVPIVVAPVQYHEDWQRREEWHRRAEWRRREAYEHWRRHEARERWREREHYRGW